jgi:hypothetical protein
MAAAKVNVIELIDRHPVTPFQIGVLTLCMLVAALDGFDTQAIGYTAQQSPRPSTCRCRSSGRWVRRD